MRYIDMFYIDIQTRKPRPLTVIALLAFVGLPSVAGDKHGTTLRVRAVSYRAIPHETTTSYTTPGYSNSTCYGSGSDWGYITRINMNCQTVTTPPKEYSNTRRTVEIYNLVEANGMAYTIRCTANWIASSCSWLVPGETFSAEVQDTTMWISGRKGGNMGKQMHTKFRIMDIRPLPSLARVQAAARAPNLAPTPVPPAPVATPAAVPTPGNPAPAPRTRLVVATQPARASSIDEAGPPQVEPEAKPELTVTSDPSGAAVEINGVAVGTTPVTIALAKGTKFELTVTKNGYVRWVTHSVANYGEFTMNANLMKEVFH